jgi:hypothetical protein
VGKIYVWLLFVDDFTLVFLFEVLVGLDHVLEELLLLPALFL